MWFAEATQGHRPCTRFQRDVPRQCAHRDNVRTSALETGDISPRPRPGRGTGTCSARIGNSPEGSRRAEAGVLDALEPASPTGMSEVAAQFAALQRLLVTEPDLSMDPGALVASRRRSCPTASPQR